MMLEHWTGRRLVGEEQESSRQRERGDRQRENSKDKGDV